MAIGRVIGAGGTAASAGGKAISGVGRSIRRTGAKFRLAGRGSLGSKVKTLVRLPLDLSSFLFVGWLGTLWFIQFILALLALIMLGIGGGLTLILNAQIFGLSLQGIIDFIKLFTGLNFNMADHFGSLFMLFTVLTLMVGMTSLALVAMRSILSLETPFWGRGAPLKIAAFLGAIMGYTIPLANLFPWVFLWMAVLMIYRD
jgi:hypothetical protein